MPEIAATITIDDEPAPDLFVNMTTLEIEEHHRLTAVFRMKIALNRQEDGLWSFLDDERLQLWKKVEIVVDLVDNTENLITGYITQINCHITEDENSSTMEIVGMDATSLMSLEEKLKDWPNKSDSDIAREIIAGYGLNAEVDDTGVIHDEAIATIIQRETDIQFLKRLARRNGFECYVDGDTAYFRKPVLDATPKPVLSAHFGAETNLLNFDARLNALRPTRVEMHQIDIIGKDLQEVVVEDSDQRQLGRDGAFSPSVPDGIDARMFVGHGVATGQEEMRNLCQAMFDEATWLIEANGEVDSMLYGSVLRARDLVPIKGVGEIFSGVYYLTKVKHVLTIDHYTQHFSARRNALAPSGPDDFGGNGSLLGGLL